jgi:hypothetical protein
MTVRKWHISRALESYSSLNRIVNELTENEVITCLHLEAGSRRRRSIINRLIQRAVRLRTIETTRQLKEQFHATS